MLDPSRWFGSAGPSGTALAIEAVIQASKHLPIRQGMIVAFERKGAQNFGGVGDSNRRLRVHSPTDVDLPQGRPLHDLGIVVRHDRIVAAKVQFLAEEGFRIKPWGSTPGGPWTFRRNRRGGTGVSEETGHLSLAVDGEISSNVKIDQLRAKLWICSRLQRMNNASSLAKIFAVVGLTVMVWILPTNPPEPKCWGPSRCGWCWVTVRRCRRTKQLVPARGEQRTQRTGD